MSLVSYAYEYKTNVENEIPVGIVSLYPTGDGVFGSLLIRSDVRSGTVFQGILA